MSRSLAVISAVFLIAGCDAKYEDVSNVAGFVERLGDVCTITDEVIIHGIRKELGAERRTDYIVVTQKPGFTGPEVTFRETLAAGTVLKIMAARRCTNCLGSRAQFLVESTSLTKHRQYHIWAPYEVLSGSVSRCQ
jgi:hypothetical protein